MQNGFDGIKGIGPKRIEALANAGIFSKEALLWYFPRKYADYSNIKTIAECAVGEEAVLSVSVSGKPSQARVNGKTITRAVLCDESGKINAVWFNQRWMFGQLADAGQFNVFGRVTQRKTARELISPKIITELCLTPVYKPIDGIPSKLLRELISSALNDSKIEETLPKSLILDYKLMPRREALIQIHFPSDRQSLNRALYRFRFEEMLCFMLSAFSMREHSISGISIDVEKTDLLDFKSALPYPLTGAQKRVIDEIISDIKAPLAMARLVQGDVGCGKTAVAFAAIYLCVKRGYQCAMMAPTEILAEQHFESAKQLLGKLGVKCGLLTGSLSLKQHRQVLKELESGECQAVFGTHALVSPNVKFNNLGLAITDEQHRFGVRQRTKLGEKGLNPNVLVMSATPIPRTVALIMYGDLDISVIDEIPPGRMPVKTRLVPESKRDGMYEFILKQAAMGKQAYFVCPLVEDSEMLEAQSAQSLFDTIKQTSLGSLKSALIYGQQDAKEKQDALQGFYEGETQLLISTTVIEVGVNVPNATVMVIENAERFGLSQLHQLRGRVGRGTDEAWCFLMANPTEKLRTLVKTNDGFEIAQKDLELRGPGDLFGTRQTGAVAGIDIRADEDRNLLALTNSLAKEYLARNDEDANIIKCSAKEWLNARNDIIFAVN